MVKIRENYYSDSSSLMVDSTSQYAETSQKEEKESLSLCIIALHLLGWRCPRLILQVFTPMSSFVSKK